MIHYVFDGICFLCLIVVFVVYDAKLIHLRVANRKLIEERDSLAERLYGSKDSYIQSLHHGWIPDEREYKVAKECHVKGIPRSNKQYPARFRGTR